MTRAIRIKSLYVARLLRVQLPVLGSYNTRPIAKQYAYHFDFTPPGSTIVLKKEIAGLALLHDRELLAWMSMFQ